MTAYTPRHAFNVVPGQPQPSLAALLFRRLRLRRKPAVPASDQLAGPVPDLIGRSWAPTALVAPRFACCVHCDTEPCDPPDNHLAPCSSGCNKPVLGDRMLSEVRAECDQPRYTQTEPIFIPSQLRETGPMPTPRPVNGRYLGDQPRRTPVPWTELREQFDPRPPRSVLERVLGGLRALDTEPGFGVDRCEADVLEAERLNQVMTP